MGSPSAVDLARRLLPGLLWIGLIAGCNAYTGTVKLTPIGGDVPVDQNVIRDELDVRVIHLPRAGNPVLKIEVGWAFEKEYRQIADQAAEDFQEILGQHFARAYTEQIKRLEQAGFGGKGPDNAQS